MALNVDLGTIKTKARQRSDQVNSPFVTDTELTSLINDAIKHLYDKLIQAGEIYYLTSNTITTDGTNDSYSLPDDFYKVMGADAFIGGTGGLPVTLKPFSFQDRNKYLNNFSANLNGTYFRYLIQANQIRFTPLPTGNIAVKIWYVPAFTDLVDDTDSFDGINGFEEWVIVETAINMKIKGEEDISELLAQRNNIEIRIRAMKQSRNIGEPSTVSDTRYRDGYEQLFHGGGDDY